MGCIDAASSGRIRDVIRHRIISVFVLAAVLVVVLFAFEFSPSTQAEIADPDVELQYEACYQQKDDEIHATAFGTIDNPDVQKEFITANRARAAAECRALHPESTIRVEEPSQFRMTPRFW